MAKATVMKQPGPDHPIAIEPSGKRVRVRFAGKLIADTTKALMMKEASYPPVYYIPRTDADMSLLKPTDHTSHCPYKGDASYFSILTDGRSADNAVWYYPQPYAAVATVKDHLAFYPSRVDAIEEE